MSFATELANFAAQYSAWNMPAYYRAALTRTTRNQHGTTYRFNDGSALHIRKGTAHGEVRK